MAWCRTPSCLSRSGLRGSSPIGDPMSTCPSRRSRPMSVRSPKVPMPSSVTCDLPPTRTWSASTTAGSTGPRTAGARERDMLLTLRHLVDTVLNCGRDVGLAIETKHPTRYASQVERELARVLGQFGLDGAYVPGRPHVCVMSNAQVAIARMRQLCPEVPLVYLIRESVPLRFRDGGLPKGAQIAGLDRAIIRR